MADNLVEATAPQLLMDFLKEKNIELRLTPQIVRQIEGGAVMIEPSQVVADFKQENSIDKN